MKKLFTKERMYLYVCSKLPLHRMHKNKEGQTMCNDDKSKERYLQRKGKVFTRKENVFTKERKSIYKVRKSI